MNDEMEVDSTEEDIYKKTLTLKFGKDQMEKGNEHIQ